MTGTMWILVLNILFANIFIGYLAGRAVLQRYDAAIDEAAESLGASAVAALRLGDLADDAATR